MSETSNETMVDELHNGFSEEGLAAIDESDPAEFFAFVVRTYEKRNTLLKTVQYKYIKDIKQWADVFYKIKTNTS